MALKDFAAQPRVARALSQALARGRLAHAYLLCGPVGSGKLGLALELAKAALCDATGDSCGACPSCLAVDAGRHPDVEIFRPEDGRVNYPVKQVREQIRGHAYLKPASGSKRFLIIDRAEALVKGSGQNEGADTLLKLLEEPPPDTVLVLLAANADRLPETVRSRCQQVRFDQPQAGALAATLAAEEKLPADEAVFIARLAGLDLAVARGFLHAKKKDKPDTGAIREALLTVATSVERQPYASLFSLAAALDASARGWPALTGALGVLALLYRDAALTASGKAGADVLCFEGGPEAEASRAAAAAHEADALSRASLRILGAQEDSRRYPARLLLMEVLLLDLAELLSTAGAARAAGQGVPS